MKDFRISFIKARTGVDPYCMKHLLSTNFITDIPDSSEIVEIGEYK